VPSRHVASIADAIRDEIRLEYVGRITAVYVSAAMDDELRAKLSRITGEVLTAVRA
jgi:hypothetical protein